MDWILATISSAIGGAIVVIFLIIEAIKKGMENFGWITERQKKRLAKQKEQRRKEYTEFTSDFLKDWLPPVLKRFEDVNEAQNKKLDELIESSNDTMRLEICRIYYKYLPYRKILQYDKESVAKLYYDYHQQGGNTFIDDVWNDIKDWEVVRGWQDIDTDDKERD